MTIFNPDFLTRDKLIAILLEDQKNHPKDKPILAYASDENIYQMDMDFVEFECLCRHKGKLFFQRENFIKYMNEEYADTSRGEEWKPDKFGPAVDVIVIG